MKYLLKYEGYMDLFSQMEDIKIQNWIIGKEKMKDRAVMFENEYFFRMLREKFINKQISMWPINNEEIISWLDTMSLIMRIFLKLQEKTQLPNDFTIYSEYVIPFSNHLRADYIISFDNYIIVFEFGMFNQDEKRRGERYSKKAVESITYCQMLRNIVSKAVNVVNYVMIYLPEYDLSINKEISENISYNETEIEKVCQFILTVLENNKQNKSKFQLEIF